MPQVGNTNLNLPEEIRPYSAETNATHLLEPSQIDRLYP